MTYELASSIWFILSKSLPFVNMCCIIIILHFILVVNQLCIDRTCECGIHVKLTLWPTISHVVRSSIWSQCLCMASKKGRKKMFVWVFFNTIFSLDLHSHVMTSKSLWNANLAHRGLISALNNTNWHFYFIIYFFHFFPSNKVDKVFSAFL